jgi:hypothetical protein
MSILSRLKRERLKFDFFGLRVLVCIRARRVVVRSTGNTIPCTLLNVLDQLGEEDEEDEEAGGRIKHWYHL